MNNGYVVVIAAFAAFGISLVTQVHAQQTEHETQQTREAPAISRVVYDKLQNAQRLTEQEEIDEAIQVLKQLAAGDRLSDYERAYTLQLLGYTHHNSGDTSAAIETYRAVLAITSLDVQLRKHNLYTLAQLLVVEGRFQEGAAAMRDWFTLESNPGPKAHAFDAQIQYQLGRYVEMIKALQRAIDIADARGAGAEEQWYTLLGFGYFQQEDYERFLEVNKVLLNRWPQKRYWMNLAHAHRELDNESEFIATYDAAHAQGLLTSEAELVTMAQLYMQLEVPLKAAQLLEGSIESGSVAESAKSLRLLAQAWSMAQEDEKSLEPLSKAAALGDDGQLYVRLGNVLLSLDRNRECVAAVEQGVEKGDLRNPDYAQITLGMCLFNLQEYRRAIRAFRQAEETPRSQFTASQWIRTIDLELARLREIDKAESLAIEKVRALEARRHEEAT